MSNQDKPAFPKQASEFSGEYFGLTQREYAAIKLRVPDSGTDWLDAMIEKSLLNEFAGKAMQGFIAYMGCDPDANDQLGGANKDMLSASSYKYATAMLKASKGE